MPFQPRKTSTRTEIIRLASRLYLEEGYTATSLSKIAKMLEISQGNVTFYFPTKEHLLSVVIGELCGFQKIKMEENFNNGFSHLFSYCLEIASIATVCEISEQLRDLFRAAYSSSLALDNIRRNDVERSKFIFSEYCPDWTEADWICAENLTSGIEFMLITTKEDSVPLDIQIRHALNMFMSIYNVPKDVRDEKIARVLAMDYKKLGHIINENFKEYVQKTNDEALKQQLAMQKKRDPWKY